MKKIFALLLALTMSVGFIGCDDNTKETDAPESDAVETDAPETDSGIMNYTEYDAAEMDASVTIETYVQATQSWWNNAIKVYAQDEDGAYFIYDMACTEEDSAKLTPGTKIRVTGVKGTWEGLIEIMDGTFEIIEGADTYIAPVTDVTAFLGTDELIDYQNRFVSFKGMTIDAIEYKNGEPGDDIYVTVSKDGATYSFCIEVYLTGSDTEVYQTVGTLTAGTVCDMEGFLYWYQGPNPHITSITVVG